MYHQAQMFLSDDHSPHDDISEEVITICTEESEEMSSLYIANTPEINTPSNREKRCRRSQSMIISCFVAF